MGSAGASPTEAVLMRNVGTSHVALIADSGSSNPDSLQEREAEYISMWNKLDGVAKNRASWMTIACCCSSVAVMDSILAYQRRYGRQSCLSTITPPPRQWLRHWPTGQK